MATTEMITCDLGTGDGAATTHTLGLDSIAVEIDLCAGHLAGLEGLLTDYLAAGRQARPRPKPPRSSDQRRRSAAIRAWAVTAGLMSAGNTRGRIPGDVIARYDAAHNGGAR